MRNKLRAPGNIKKNNQSYFGVLMVASKLVYTGRRGELLTAANTEGVPSYIDLVIFDSAS